MTPPARPVIFHHHGFKCAGTTLSAILEHNFPGAVLYVEADRPSHRLPWQATVRTITRTTPQAVSSHLATVPARGESLARMHVGFVREPRARLVSAFLFQKATADRDVEGHDFIRFLEHNRHGRVANYQTRHLSVQDHGGWQRRQGWEARPELLSFSRPDLFVGVVERMDESLLVLERRLGAVGIPFDAAWLEAQNVTPANARLLEVMRSQVPDDMVELDDVLYCRANAALTMAVRRLGISPEDLYDFRQRAVHAATHNPPVVVPDPATWTYLPTTLGARYPSPRIQPDP